MRRFVTPFLSPDAEPAGRPAKPGRGVHEQGLLDCTEMREIRTGIAVGREAGAWISPTQGLEAAELLVPATIGRRERAIHAAVAPGNARADRLFEAEALADGWHV